MKKTISMILCVAIVLGVLFCFGACGNGNETETTEETDVKEYVIGRYELKKIEWEDGTVSSDETLQKAEETMGDMYVELFRDGTAQLSLYGQIHDMEFSDDEMWEINGAAISYDFSVKNGKVTLENQGDTYIFIKK